MNNASFITACHRIMTDNGLAPDAPIADGALHRCSTAGKEHSKDGAYILHLDPPASLWWCNHRTGQNGTHTAKPESRMTKEEYQAFSARAAKEKEQRKADKQARHTKAAANAQEIWQSAAPATNDHPYLTQKEVPCFGLKTARNGHLVVPVIDETGKLQSLQFIPPDGKEKRFLPGGRTQGGYFSITAKDGSKTDTLCIAEGYATAASIHLATGYAVLAAFNAGNLEAVARMARKQYPDRPIILCADNDASNATKGKGNIGIEKATAAATAIGAKVAIPLCHEGRSTDFNDLHIWRGLDIVAACIAEATSPREQAQAHGSPKHPLCVVNLRELLELQVPPRRYLLHPVIPEQGLCMVFADRGTGKTFAALHMAFAVASGGQVFSWRSEEPCPVLYIDGEMPLAAMQQRIAALVASSDLESPEDFLRVLTPDLQGEAAMPNLATKEGQTALEPYLQGVKLVVIDNLATLCRYGRSNDEESWLPVQEWILGLRRRGISVLLVHHSSKSGVQRGTSAKEDILDTVIQLRRPKDYTPEEGARFEVHLTKARGIVGEEAEPFEAQLSMMGDKATWIVKSIEDTRAEQVRTLAGEGLTMRDIAEELGITKSTVNRLCRKHGITTKGGKK